MAKHLLRGKVIAITGGASGIGFATVQKLIALEAKIAVADISPCPDTLAGVPNLTFTRVNVTSREQVHDWVVAIVAKFGRLDGMCANAGINVEDGSLEPDFAYHKTVDVRLTGVWHCGTEAHWQFQRQQSPGVICITSSLAGLRPSPNTPIYSAVKAATIGFTRAWALDWAAEGIRVNSVAPGVTLTEGFKTILKSVPEFDMIPKIPMKRGAEPSEQADAIIFLLGETSSFITGQVIVCDGGALISGS